MNRWLATVLLVLLILGQVLSIYAFSQGRLKEGLLMFPLLIAIYVLFKVGRKGEK